MSRRSLGQLEAEVLAALAACGGSAGTSDLLGRLSGDPAYTTVNTILFRLLDKGLVTRTREGRHFRYELIVDESELVADRMHDHLRRANDPGSVLSRFVETLSADEVRSLREILRPPGERA
ncbi:BlaI/MecI/CopY family transcriptional regulator [Spirillospora sp. NPDC047279]|uniref:BlaI/MecI/CopY family transcriptional regulator n=1 Tax=Spirillospora sp. NPDC047279 TaxID=3155478 RepID=UPI0033DEB39F